MFMEIFYQLFKRKQKQKWEVLKLYSSISDSRPSTIDREQFIDELLRVYSDYYKEAPKLFDIYGPYLISKGRPVGLKRFKNLLDKYGYEKFHGLIMADKEHTRYIYFTDNAQDLKKRNLANGYQELIFAQQVPAFGADLRGAALTIFKSFKFDYGYITYLPENFEVLNEAKLTGWLGSIGTTYSAADMTWRKNTRLILDGEIKDVYEFNILNQKQTEASFKRIQSRKI